MNSPKNADQTVMNCRVEIVLLSNSNANPANAFRSIICAMEARNVKTPRTNRLSIAHQDVVHRLVFDVVTVRALMKRLDAMEM